MRLAHDALVVVADGRKALFLRNEGDDAYPNLQVDSARERVNPADRDQKTGPAGRSSGGGGGVGQARAAMGEADFHQLEEDRFAAEITDMLKKKALAHDFESLIVIAPPRTLGEMRKRYHVEVANRLTGELDKDLTGHQLPDIEQAIVAA